LLCGRIVAKYFSVATGMRLYFLKKVFGFDRCKIAGTPLLSNLYRVSGRNENHELGVFVDV